MGTIQEKLGNGRSRGSAGMRPAKGTFERLNFSGGGGVRGARTSLSRRGRNDVELTLEMLVVRRWDRGGGTSSGAAGLLAAIGLERREDLRLRTGPMPDDWIERGSMGSTERSAISRRSGCWGSSICDIQES